jgi:hypothetical protein
LKMHQSQGGSLLSRLAGDRLRHGHCLQFNVRQSTAQLSLSIFA